MSWLLLVFGAWCALHAFNAWRPVRRNRVLFVWSFFAAWLTIEAAPFWLVIELVVGALLVWGGALDHIVGWIGLGLLVAAWLDQVVLIVQGRAATATAVQAFGDFGRDVLGDRAAIPTEKVVVERNIEFRRVAGKRLRLDVYRPASDGQRRPAVLQIHGGAWVIGDKREQGIPLLRHLASHGWVGFNVNYRLSPGATFPDHLVDVKAALAWIRGHADDYGIDPDFVVVTGGSAGGHLTALMGLTANDARYQPGFEHADTSVQAAVPFYGIYDFTNRGATMAPEFNRWIAEPLVIKAFLDEEPERFADASPLDHIRPDAPPFLVIHGDNDTLAPVEDARAFVAQLSAVSSSPVVYVELHGAQHAFDVFRSPRTRRMVRAVEQFLFVVHLGHTGAEPAPTGGRTRDVVVRERAGSARPAGRCWPGRRTPAGPGLDPTGIDRVLTESSGPPDEVADEVAEPNLAGRAGMMIAAYVGMGLPTAALGVAWPSMRAEVGRPLSSLGLLIVAFTAGYLISTTGHGWLGRQLGTGTLLVVASGLAAVAAATFAATSTWTVLLVAAVVLGVSGGVVDAALNAHVALYHSGRMMNLMHGGFGVGATLGPLVMTALIGAGLSWRWGYGALALLQLGLAVGFATTRRHWPAAKSGPRQGRHVAGPVPPAAWLGPLVFFAYGAVEVGVGAWAFVLLTGRGLGDTAAGVCVTAYWGALAAGRLGLGALGARVTPRQVVAGSVVGVAVGSVALWLLPAAAAPVALVALGASLAGIFPALTALTPARVGPERAPAVIGRQLATAVIGGAVGSAVIGVLAQHLGSAAVAPAVVVVSLGLVVTNVLLTLAST